MDIFLIKMNVQKLLLIIANDKKIIAKFNYINLKKPIGHQEIPF